MSKLEKATLEEISADAAAKPVDGTKIAVQFNPASLKLELANKVEGGDVKSRQVRQYLGKTSTTLSFDLHFDSADLGDTDRPVSVRTLTSMVERFVLPKGNGNTKQKPPKARFHWDQLKIDGIIESVSIDFDLFASNGTPLRAKMGVTLKEQDAKYELAQSKDGAQTANTASLPGVSGAGPGSTGGPAPDRSADALGGESASDFASRMGLDPAAWRGIAAAAGGASLSLAAGATIDFSSNLSVGAGIGVSAGIEAGLNASLGASFGLDVSASASLSMSAEASAGFALSAAGGVTAAIETVAIVQAQSAATAARQSFGNAVPAAPPPPPATTTSARATAIGAASVGGLSAASATAKPSMPDQSRTPLQLTGSTTPASAAGPAPAPPLADPRATSFGFGVPLRPRVGSAADLRASAAAGRIPLRPRTHISDVPVTSDPTAAPWTYLPPDAVRRTADRVESRRYPTKPCSCGCGCRH
jgi:hypothetical protein